MCKMSQSYGLALDLDDVCMISKVTISYSSLFQDTLVNHWQSKREQRSPLAVAALAKTVVTMLPAGSHVLEVRLFSGVGG